MGRSTFPPLLLNLPSGIFLSLKHQGLGCRISRDVASVLSGLKNISGLLFVFSAQKVQLKTIAGIFSQVILAGCSRIPFFLSNVRTVLSHSS